MDPKSVVNRVKVEFLPDNDLTETESAAIKLEGPDGQGALLVKAEQVEDAIAPVAEGTQVKLEADRMDW